MFILQAASLLVRGKFADAVKAVAVATNALVSIGLVKYPSQPPLTTVSSSPVMALEQLPCQPITSKRSAERTQCPAR